MKKSIILPNRLNNFTPQVVIKAALITLICALLLVGGVSAAIVRHEIVNGLPDYSNITDDWQITPDGAIAVIKSDITADGLFNLYSVPTRGGTPIQLNEPFVYGGNIDIFTVSPNSQYVVFVCDLESDERFELFSVPINGGEQVKLNPTLAYEGDVSIVYISPDSQGVVYYADQGEDEDFNLYSVPINGGTSINLTLHLPDGYDQGPSSVKITPDSHGVVFSVRYPGSGWDLYYVQINGGGLRKLNDSGEYNGINHISPDGQFIVYHAYQESSDTTNIYRVPIGGGASIQLNPDLVAGGEVSSATITPNSQRVVFYAEQDVLDQEDLFSVSSDGLELIELYDLSPGEDSRGFKITPNSLGVVYSIYDGTAHTGDIYSIYMDGTNRTQLNPTLAYGRSVTNFHITPNSLGVVYTADQDLADVDELYSVYINGANPTKLNPNFTPWQDIDGFLISPNSLAVVYQADLETDDRFELYVVPSWGGVSAKLNGEYYGMIWRYLITPDNRSVIYGTINADYKSVLFIAYNANLAYIPLVRR